MTNNRTRNTGTGTASLDAARTAVVIVDMINHQCVPGQGMLAAWEASGVDTSYIVERVRDVTIPATQRLVTGARVAGTKIVFLRVGAYDASYADLTPAFRGIAPWEPRADLWGSQVIDEIDVCPGDISLIKTGSGGFYTSALDSHLRNMGIENVLYAGVITNGCVLLTAAGGMDRGYRGYLVADATATVTESLQLTTEHLIDGFIATVVDSHTVVEALVTGKSIIPPAPNPVVAWSRR